MQITSGCSNSVPTGTPGVILSPYIRVIDDVLPGETPHAAYRRISTMANALWARELLNQVQYSDRRVEIGNAEWCEEFLSSVAKDHPIEKPLSSSTPPEVIEASKVLVKFLSSQMGSAVKNIKSSK